ncbi:MAG TPA: 3-methyl-2-oxobutanoate hydroxymethyltransferase [Mycobacteriales bacterium]|jgi:3-methyl-2-oxobutanoate hydroxymethyltransferase|nr:3-methyl-2-oxobutanoate hydroxymethyltransferase [Mycobacteriales bacterium]
MTHHEPIMQAPYGGLPREQRVTVRDLQAMTDRGEKWAMLTSYDAMTAGIFEHAGVPCLLVGDSAAMTVFGHGSTLPMTVDLAVALTQAVVRGTHRALIVADMPFGSYQGSPQQALDAAVRLMAEGGAHAVKLEGGRRVLPQVELLVASGIPVMGHVGLTPQSVNAFGGPRVQGRGDAGDALLDDALALEAAGAFSVVLEAVPAELGSRISEHLHVPTIGIGAGAGTDAQVLVWQDMAGLTVGHLPKFVKRYANIAEILEEAARTYVKEVSAGIFPDEEHAYR